MLVELKAVESFQLNLLINFEAGLKISTLKKRSSFEFANKFAKKISTKGLVLQLIEKKQIEELFKEGAKKPLFSVYDVSELPKFGFTATKRVGGAVVRNKCKRRLRALVQKIIQTKPELFIAGNLYIFIARTETITRNFEMLLKDAKYALYNIGKIEDGNSKPNTNKK